ncbi:MULTISPECIES: choice-of-anchor D domain-containing protein [unclassified Flavobacterium]|uniref:choice-of-anchor D domain-containing protein n=1 Tax=unclassified Flavobacterium TaxID=196869 RepID=UPI00139689E2|nr:MULTISPECIES: choice-of-anchor D domain-containing protein [unclassified Flavobacterium]
MKLKLKLLIGALFCSILGWGQATLPVTRTVWNSTPTGWTDTPMDSYLTTFACSGSNGAKFDTSGDRKIVDLDSAPDQLSFVVKSNSSASTSVLLVEESIDGVSYTTVVSLTGTVGLPTTCSTKGPYTLSSSSRYVRWTFTKGSSNMTMDDVNITKSAVTDAVDYCNLQSPASGTITQDGVFNVYAQAYEPGVTEAAGIGTGILGWIGYSSANTDPSTGGWTWVAASFNTQIGNNDELVADIGSGLAPGTYYYASRFQLNGGPFRYGGYNGGFWDGTSNVNGVLTVNPSVVDFCNVQFPASGTITQGGTFIVYAQVYEPGVTEAAGQGAGIQGWIGYNTTNNDPSLAAWTWVPATFNTQSGNNDEYQAEIGSLLPAGTYYYASRFQLGSGAYRYGGYNGGFWDGTTNVNGVLTVTAPPVITSSLTASGNVGSAFTYDIVATNTPTSYNATSLPSGLSINTTTGQISGTPTGAGVFNVTISATNAYGTDTETLEITFVVGPCLSESFESGNPSGWLINGTVLGGQFCEGAQGLVFNNSGDNVITTAIANPQTLTFYKKRSSGTDAWSMNVEVSTSSSGPWTNVVTISTISTSCQLETVDLSAYVGGTYFIRFIDARPSGTQQRTIDDVKVYCGTPLDVEIDVEGNSVSIVDGDTTPSATDDTDFGSTLVGVDVSHTFTITNAGPDDLDISGVTITGVDAADFYVSIAPASTVAAGGSTTFEITFNPTVIGVSNATINIANNDSDENPYTFDITGEAITCTPTTSVSSITPTSGPIGTIVTINGSGFATATSVHFGIYSAAFTVVSGSLIQATVPANATTGNIVIQDAGGCDLSYSSFTVIEQDNSTCDPTAIGIGDLFISEVTDASTGSLSYIQIFNATGATIDMSDYEVQIRNNGSGTGDDIPLTGILLNGGTFVLATSAGTECAVPGGDGSYADQNDVSSGVNNNDCIHLAKLGVVIDTWGVCNGTNWINALGLGSAGYDFKRNPTATPLPSTTFVSTDWSISDFNACNDNYDLINSYEGIRVPPTATSLGATYGAGCSSATVSVTGTEAIVGGAPLTYQWYYSAPGDIGWTMVTNGGIFSDATTDTLSISDITGLVGYQYYCQVMEDTATCFIASAAVQIGGGATTTWDGTVWSNGIPNSGMLAIIDGDYDTLTDGDFSCCSLLVNPTYTLDIQANNYVEIQYNLTVNGVLNVWNNGSLVQVDDSGVNTGNISYRRATTGVALDYVYWSSPVNGVNTPSGYIYTWSPVVTNPNGGQGNWAAAANTAMQSGIGYIMRGILSRNFVGVPRNGVYTPTIKRGSDLGAGSIGPNGIMRTVTDDNWNLLGNPYPSAISINSFLTANTELDGFVRLWTHGTLPSSSVANPFYDNFVYNYTASDYIAINGSGATSGAGTLSVIGSGQGFFVLMNPGAATTSTALFNNSMRDKGYSNSQFYRNSNSIENNSVGGNLERHRIWLDFVTPSQTTRTLVAYVEGATTGKDRMFDAFTDYKSAQNFYSLIDNDIMTIQGRSLPFDVNDQIPMGFKTSVSGNFSIAIAEVDGLFTANQKIYIEDKELGIIHDLKTNPYSFTATSGVNNTRFVLRYTNETLGSEDFENDATVLVSSTDVISISAPHERIQSVQIHNVLGQLLVNETAISASSFQVNSLQKNTVPLIVQITLENGVKVTKKIVF